MKKYRLLKDLPTFNKGGIFCTDENGTLYEINTKIVAYYHTTIAKYPNILSEWFEEITEPLEPLIKNEKIRKAVRAWAEANEIETAEYDDYWVSFRSDDKVISFKDEYNCIGLYNFEDHQTYTITELCGEEDNYEETKNI